MSIANLVVASELIDHYGAHDWPSNGVKAAVVLSLITSILSILLCLLVPLNRASVLTYTDDDDEGGYYILLATMVLVFVS